VNFARKIDLFVHLVWYLVYHLLSVASIRNRLY